MFFPILLNVVGFMRPCFAGTETAMPKHQTSLEKIEQKIERKKNEAVFLAREFTTSAKIRSCARFVPFWGRAVSYGSATPYGRAVPRG